MLISRSLISFVQQSANVFKSFRQLETDCNIQGISLSVVSNMSKYIIKSIKFCIGNGLIEFGIPEL